MTEAPDDDFGALLEESLSRKRKRFSVGERVRATVVQVGHESLILDLGDGQDGLMDLKELGDDPERPEIREGDVLEAHVLRFDGRVAELGLKAAKGGTGNLAAVESAMHAGLPVDGTVAEVNKGGYVVDVGGTRAFCPLGAMDVRRIEDPSVMIGRKLLFRVTEVKGLRDVVLSRRALLEEEAARKAAETRDKLKIGARLKGTVTGVRDFGAFVDLGGIDGLIPVSEMGFGRVQAADAVKIGQPVDVEVLRMEPGKDGRERITLSMKALLADPFPSVVADLPAGLVVAGKVTRTQPFGAFVEIVPGVEGLIHVSAFGRRVAHPSDAVKPGQEVAVRVEGVDADARRIALHLADAAELASESATTRADGVRVLRHAEPPSEREPVITPESAARREAPQRPPVASAKPGDVVDGEVDRVEQYGVFVQWSGGRGLVPARELGLPRGADLRRQFAVGTKMRVVVMEVREDGKISLSKTGVERMEERAETDAYMKSSGPSTGRGLGTLGDLLKAKKGR